MCIGYHEAKQACYKKYLGYKKNLGNKLGVDRSVYR